jgi:hypothetical protein
MNSFELLLITFEANFFLGSWASSENWLSLELNYHKSVKHIVDFLSSSSENFVWILKLISLASTNICIIVKNGVQAKK